MGWRGASAPAFAFAPAAPLLLLPRRPFHSPRLRLSAADAELPFPCEGGSGGQAPSESCGDDEAMFFLSFSGARFKEKKGQEKSSSTTQTIEERGKKK